MGCGNRSVRCFHYFNIRFFILKQFLHLQHILENHVEKMICSIIGNQYFLEKIGSRFFPPRHVESEKARLLTLPTELTNENYGTLTFSVAVVIFCNLYIFKVRVLWEFPLYHRSYNTMFQLLTTTFNYHSLYREPTELYHFFCSCAIVAEDVLWSLCFKVCALREFPLYHRYCNTRIGFDRYSPNL